MGKTVMFHGNLEEMRRAAFTSAWISRTQPLNSLFRITSALQNLFLNNMAHSKRLSSTNSQLDCIVIFNYLKFGKVQDSPSSPTKWTTTVYISIALNPVLVKAKICVVHEFLESKTVQHQPKWSKLTIEGSF